MEDFFSMTVLKHKGASNSSGWLRTFILNSALHFFRTLFGGCTLWRTFSSQSAGRGGRLSLTHFMPPAPPPGQTRERSWLWPEAGSMVTLRLTRCRISLLHQAEKACRASKCQFICPIWCLLGSPPEAGPPPEAGRMNVFANAACQLPPRSPAAR